MGARTDLATHLERALPPTWRVVPNDVVETISRPTVLVYRTNVAPGQAQGLRESTLSVVVVGPKQVAAMDDLDAYLDAVLAALDDYPAATWDDAEVSVYDEKYPAFKITARMTTTRED